MRMLIWGIVGLSGLGLAVQSIGVHGSTDERAAIRRAIHAPFADLKRRDAQALCEDFTPSVAAQLASGAGGCERRVSALFRLAQSGAEYVQPGDGLARGRLAVSAIHWRGSRATAAVGGRPQAGGVHDWRLDMRARRWRITTPIRLEVRKDCSAHPFGASGCVYALSMRTAAG
jgi:hypothetical protein